MMTVLAVLAVLVLVGAPLFVIMGATTMALFFSFGGPEYHEWHSYQSLVLAMTDLTTKNVFLAIPFFVAAGTIMTEGGIAKRLIRIADALVGWMPGGLAVSAVVSSMVFAAISASSPVTLIAVGSIMFPALTKAGYKEDFSLGLVTSAGSLGSLLPPSLSLIIYALAVSSTAPVEIGDLFLGGLSAGVLIVFFLSIYCVWHGLQMKRTAFDWDELRHALREGSWALFLPVIIVGGIYTGFFTATEAAAVAVIYATFVTVFIFRELQIKSLPALFLESAVLIGTIIFIVVFSFALNGFLVESNAAEFILGLLRDWNLGPVGFFVVMNVFLILIGALMDSISATLIFAPLLAPVAISLGIDPIHLGIVFVVNMEIGYLMPPVATNLFVSAAVFGKPFGQVVRAVLPTMTIIIVGLFVIIFVPTISNGFVNLAHGRPVYQPFPWDGKPHPVESEVAGEAPAAEEAAPETAEPQSKTLQQIMEEAKRKEQGGAATEVQAEVKPAPAAEEPKRAKSLQELMEEAKKGQAKE